MEKKNNRRKSFIKAISAIYRYSQSYIGEKASRYNIGKGQWSFLTQLLFEEDGITQEELSERLHIDKANTARAIKKLEDEGYVCRQEDAMDGRKKRLYVTEKSKDFEEEFHSIFKGLNKVLTEGFTDGEKDIARDLLYRMLDNIAEYREEHRK